MRLFTLVLLVSF